MRVAVVITPDENDEPLSGRFIEVENEQGASISVGEWEHDCPDGYHRLWFKVEDAQRIADLRQALSRISHMTGIDGGVAMGVVAHKALAADDAARGDA